MADNYRIRVQSNKGDDDTIETDGYLVLYMDDSSNIQMTGTMDTELLGPIVTKTLLQWMVK